jgi:hypothetical protein
MIQTRDSHHTQPIEHNTPAVTARPTIFYPTPQAARRTRLLATLFLLLSAPGSILLAIAALRFWPTYTHPFTPYLKWQDALLATLCYCSLLLIIASITLLRYSLASRQGSRHGILILSTDQGTLTVRDLSPKNFHAIAHMITASLTCFAVTLVGLAPTILIGWTLHFTHPLASILATALALALSLAGLTLSLIFATFLVIGLIGARALTRTLGAPHTYHLTPLTTLRIDNNTLTITCPDRPETLFDLNLLHPHDQRHLLHLLQQHTRYGSITHPHTLLDQHIEAALQHSLNRPPLSV